ncbi:MAG: chemotaxis protein CheX [Thermodesulfobacteriota bacterium]|nr:chemotaxis protein CheX [Thermodesulfobacteriota bacterium]
MSGMDTVDIKTTLSDSVIDVFDTMLSLEVKISETGTENLVGNRFMGMVKFAGEMVGIVAIQVSHDFARLMTGSMQGIGPEEVEGDEEIKDLLAELSNIIGGKLKSTYTDIGLYCKLTTPSITTGSDFTMQSLNMDQYERLVFLSQGHPIIVEGVVKQGKADSDLKTSAGKTKRPPIDPKKFKAINVKDKITGSVTDIFKTMLSMDVKRAETVSKESVEGIRNVGSVNFAGDITGIINFQVSDEFARLMTASMLGMEITELEGQEEINDFIAEISNIIGGNLKGSYRDIGIICELSTPSITKGNDFKIESLNMTTYERFAFKSNEHDIFVEVGIKTSDILRPELRPEKDIHYSVDEGDTPKDKEPKSPEAVDGKAAETAEPKKALSVDAESTGAVDQSAASSNIVSQGPADKSDDMKTASVAIKNEVGKTTERSESKAAGNDENSANENGQAKKTDGIVNLDVILDIPLEITVELGRTKIPIHELLEIGPGSAVSLSTLEGESVDILANNTLIAKGIVLVKNEKYGIRITKITRSMDRIKGLL